MTNAGRPCCVDEPHSDEAAYTSALLVLLSQHDMQDDVLTSQA